MLSWLGRARRSRRACYALVIGIGFAGILLQVLPAKIITWDAPEKPALNLETTFGNLSPQGWLSLFFILFGFILMVWNIVVSSAAAILGHCTMLFGLQAFQPGLEHEARGPVGPRHPRRWKDGGSCCLGRGCGWLGSGDQRAGFRRWLWWPLVGVGREDSRMQWPMHELALSSFASLGMCRALSHSTPQPYSSLSPPPTPPHPPSGC
jgi:hypothetical protein